MNKEKSGINCVFPAYNKEKNIENVVKEAIKVFVDLKLGYEVIVVDDGSEDKTSEITLRMAKENKNIRLIKHPHNYRVCGCIENRFSIR